MNTEAFPCASSYIEGKEPVRQPQCLAHPQLRKVQHRLATNLPEVLAIYPHRRCRSRLTSRNERCYHAEADRRIAKSPKRESARENFRFISSGDTMKATNWEFTNRALLFGLIFTFSFPLHFLDHQNSTAALASWLGPRLQRDPDLVARNPVGPYSAPLISGRPTK
jgi:hypothetical protein